MTTLAFKPRRVYSPASAEAPSQPISEPTPGEQINQGRRSLFALVGGAAIGAGALVYGIHNYLPTLDSALNPGEEVRIFGVPENPNLRQAQYRGSTFRFYEMTATVEDNGLHGLVFRANREHGTIPIKGDIATRAADLFSRLDKNNVDIENDATLKLKSRGTSGINEGRSYKVPVYIN